MNRSGYYRLCLLVHQSLHSYTEKSEISITREQEKHLLITLSQVLKQIKIWTLEFDCDSGSDHDDVWPEVGSDTECPVDSAFHSSPSDCLTKMIGDLVLVLAFESQYVRHLAENVLVSISQYVAASDNYWDEFMHAICFFFELAVCNLLSPSVGSPHQVKDINCDSLAYFLDTRPILKNACWTSVSGIILVLRNILKHLKHLQDDQLFVVYLSSLCSCLQKVPWDLCNEIYAAQINAVRQPKPWVEFCGHLVQLCCSLVGVCSSAKEAGDSLEKHPTIHEIYNIIPKVLFLCLGEQGDCIGTVVSQYIKHKILVLMIRLSSLVDLDYEMAISWLHLIHNYFEDLLLKPLTMSDSDQDDCLEGSPFLPSLSDLEKKTICQRHLQRLVICLFLRCSFNLICRREGTKEQCLWGNLNSSLILEKNCGPGCCRKKGLMELYEWLQKHLPADILVNSQLYSERCKIFTKSFLQLYMHEDDMMFKVLLQLSSAPFVSEQRSPKDRNSWDVEHDILVLISDLFNPIGLFHVFLAELLYDHQVLLDYLISKDTGASCAEYLLRGLRNICDSWILFMGFSSTEESKLKLCCKRKKAVASHLDMHQELTPAEVKGEELPLAFEMACKTENMHQIMHRRINRLAFGDAKECLLSLKRSVENLHQKDLFPYNPEVLLRRLKRFQDLCLRH